jgi:lysophospholipase L1-like esterase
VHTSANKPVIDIDSSMAQSSRHRHIIFALAVLGVPLAVVEVALRLASPALQGVLGLQLVPTSEFVADHARRADVLLRDPTTRTVLDSLVGWRYRPGFESEQDRINLSGLRSAREFTPVPRNGVRRIAAFGDSFVFGSEVGNDETWVAALERESGDLEILNYGVGGFGTDQAYLLYLRDGAEYSPDVVLIGFAPINLRRAENVYPRFISSSDVPVVKPRFVLEGDTLRLLPNPLPSREAWERTIRQPHRILDVGEHDVWFDPVQFENPLFEWSATVRVSVTLGVRIWRKYLWSGRLLSGEEFRPEAPAFALQLELLETFADSVRARGAQPAVVIFPDHASLQRVLGAPPGERGSRVRPVYAPMRDSLVARGHVPVFDLLDAFAAAGTVSEIPGWFAPGLHYSPTGNLVVARWLKDQLATLPLY